jgi:23S rRNA (adenine2503-C2)-methyltransferase
VNPTLRAGQNRISSLTEDAEKILSLPACRALRKDGYEILASIGELEENQIGSNCGQYIRAMERGGISASPVAAYSYPLVRLNKEA